ncbi:integrating conjugative element protein [Erwinia psidii]|uniref:Integrating conjugative element protein n=1 Tax=Erwinia psidii TaxID=69224 RepID=A0A3N6RXS3_9GAMM|nr:integrating conjugative element protein [Erwinia psidii]MCX8957030.1 integrating conjugative element protein [Erwinia psidii]MCX8965288.1 integrating conjugative element protein [Erwinia psidii]RQM37914.1 integrating conjugative element protein [Erwinia psidii]
MTRILNPFLTGLIFSKLLIGFLLLGFAGLLISTTFAEASLTIVGDLGGQPTAPLFDAVNADAGKQDEVPENLQPPASLSISDMLPVSTPEMTPGQLASRPLNLPGMPPVFVVGDDPLSHSWLAQHVAELRQQNATGMVINVHDEPALTTLRQLVPGVEMVPVRGSDLSHRLNLTHYPALITATGISQ